MRYTAPALLARASRGVLAPLVCGVTGTSMIANDSTSVDTLGVGRGSGGGRRIGGVVAALGWLAVQRRRVDEPLGVEANGADFLVGRVEREEALARVSTRNTRPGAPVPTSMVPDGSMRSVIA